MMHKNVAVVTVRCQAIKKHIETITLFITHNNCSFIHLSFASRAEGTAEKLSMKAGRGEKKQREQKL